MKRDCVRAGCAPGPNIDRKTFIIGKDGQVKTSFVDIGYDADKTRLTNHVAEVGVIRGKSLNPNGREGFSSYLCIYITIFILQGM